MINYNFQYEKKCEFKIKLISYGLSFNSKCIEALGFAKSVNIGIDSQNMAMIIKPSTKCGEEREYRFVTSEYKKKSLVVTARNITDELLKIMNCYLEWGGMSLTAIKKENALIVDLSHQK